MLIAIAAKRSKFYCFSFFIYPELIQDIEVAISSNLSSFDFYFANLYKINDLSKGFNKSSSQSLKLIK